MMVSALASNRNLTPSQAQADQDYASGSQVSAGVELELKVVDRLMIESEVLFGSNEAKSTCP